MFIYPIIFIVCVVVSIDVYYRVTRKYGENEGK